MEADDRFTTVVVPFEVLDIIVEELHIAKVDGMIDLPVGEDEVDGL